MTAEAVDAILTRLGICGFFPLGIYFIAWLPAFPQTFSLMAASYSTINAGFRCPNLTVEWVVNGSGEGGGGGGGKADGGGDGDDVSDNTNNHTMTLMPFAKTAEEVNAACARGCNTSWEFDAPKETSIVVEWGLVCEKEYLVNLSNTAFMVGVMIACFLAGTLSDRLGRRRTTMWMAFAMAAIGVNSIWISSPYLFIAMRFFAGFPYIGVDPNWTYIAELWSSSRRLIMMGLLPSWSLGMATTALIAWGISNSWRHLYVLLSLCSLIIIPIYAFLPDSLYFMVRQGRIKGAKQLLVKVAKSRRINIDEELKSLEYASSKENSPDPEEKLALRDIHGEKEVGFEPFDDNNNNNQSSKHDKVYEGGWRVFLNKTYSLSIFFGSLYYIYNAMVYFGMAMDFQTHAGNKYLNSFLMALIEVPTTWLVLFFLLFPTRRLACFFFVALSVFAMILTIALRISLGDEFQEYGQLRFGISLLGKFAITGSFSIQMIFLQEIFPTSVRSRSTFLCCFFSRLGSIAATFMSLANRKNPLLVEIVICSIGLLVLVGISLMPETKGRALPQTMKDLVAMKKETKPFIKDCRCGIK